MPQIFDPVNPTIQVLDDSIEGGAVIQVDGDIPDNSTYTTAKMKWDRLSLAQIRPGSLTKTQQQNLITAIGIVQTPPAVINDLDVKGRMSTDNYRFINGKVFGLRRLTQADCTSYSDRAGVAPVVNTWAALNGTGVTSLYHASYQWLTFNFNSQNIWRVILTHRNVWSNWSRQLSVNGNVVKELINADGSFTETWESPNASGYTPSTSVNYSEAQVRTYIDDWQVLVSSPTPPPLTNGYLLTVGDFFRLDTTQGIITYLRYDGVDPTSGAWWATPIDRLTAFDGSLIAGSTNAPQSSAVFAAINAQRDYTDQRFNEAIAKGTEWIFVDTLAQRDTMTIAQGGGKLVRVSDAGAGRWAVYRGVVTFPDNPTDPQTLTWALEFDQTSSGVIPTTITQQITTLQTTVTQQATTIANQATENTNQATQLANQATQIANLQTTTAQQTTTITNQATQITNLQTQLQNQLAIAQIWRSSFAPPNFDLTNWRFWQHTDWVGDDLRVRLYQRVSLAEDAILIQDYRYFHPFDDRSAIAVPGQTGIFRVNLGENSFFSYDFAHSQPLPPVIGGFSYGTTLNNPDGRVTRYEFEGFTAQGVSINSLNGGFTPPIGSSDFNIRDIQQGVKAAYWILKFTVDGVQLNFKLTVP